MGGKSDYNIISLTNSTTFTGPRQLLGPLASTRFCLTTFVFSTVAERYLFRFIMAFDSVVGKGSTKAKSKEGKDQMDNPSENEGSAATKKRRRKRKSKRKIDDGATTPAAPPPALKDDGANRDQEYQQQQQKQRHQNKQQPQKPHWLQKRQQEMYESDFKRPRKQPPSQEALDLSARLKELSARKNLQEALDLYWSPSNDNIRDTHHACILVDCAARCGAIHVRFPKSRYSTV